MSPRSRPSSTPSRTRSANHLAEGVGTLEGRPESYGFCSRRAERRRARAAPPRPARHARPAPRGSSSAGRGSGLVGALAREVGFTVTGVEVVPAYIEHSRRMFPAVRVEEADLTTFDRFGAFDVVYYYRPFADEAMQASFERRVEARSPARRRRPRQRQGHPRLARDGGVRSARVHRRDGVGHPEEARAARARIADAAEQARVAPPPRTVGRSAHTRAAVAARQPPASPLAAAAPRC